VTIRQDMLRTAHRGGASLGAEACRELVRFLQAGRTPDGGYAGRDGRSDLYYTVFAVESLSVLGFEVDSSHLAGYLQGFGGGVDADLVHLASLARCWSALPEPHRFSHATRQTMLARLAEFRTPDGLYAGEAGDTAASLYGCFLAVGTMEDLQQEVPALERLLSFVASLACEGGGYANDPEIGVATTPTTAAALALLDRFGRPTQPEAAESLLRCYCPEGGFAPAEILPHPDLLSTATALHALARVRGLLEPAARDATRRWVLSLRVGRAGFCGSTADPMPDSEYTWYALLALGELGGADA
jgi:prenyltransferase beta subunit